MDDLEKRVNQFSLLQLPGQPMAMHMGTSYLVNDLWREVRRLRSQQANPSDADLQCPACYEKMTERRECKKCGHTERR